MLVDDIAIIGIDSQCQQLANIDQLARALYEGSTEPYRTTEALPGIAADVASSLVNNINASVARMLAAISPGQLPQSQRSQGDSSLNERPNYLAEVETIIVIATENYAAHYASYQAFELEPNHHLVNQLSSALCQALTFIEQGKCVALFGVNLVDFNKNTGTKNEHDGYQSPINRTNNSTDGSELINTISFDQDFFSYGECAGLAGLLMVNAEQAVNDDLPVYAQLKGFGESNANAQAMQDAIGEVKTKVAQNNIALIEVSALADQSLAELEASVLINTHSGQPLTQAISCARSVLGEGGGLSQLMGLLRTVIALKQGYIPAIKDWQAPQGDLLAQWQASTMYFASESRPLYPVTNRHSHYAAYSCLSAESYCYVLLSQAADIQVDKVDVSGTINSMYSGRNNGHLAHSKRKLFVINGNNQEQLQAQLTDLLATLKKPVKSDKFGNSLDQSTLSYLAKHYYQTYLSKAQQHFAIALVADSVEALINELTLAQHGVASVFTTLAVQSSVLPEAPLPRQAQSSYWKTPSGSYFTCEPVNQPRQTQSCSEADDAFSQPSQQQSQQHSLEQSQHAEQNATRSSTKAVISTSAAEHNALCFMYPGIGATYVGLGRDLLQMFPQIYPHLLSITEDVGYSLKDLQLHPRSVCRLDAQALKQHDLTLRGKLSEIAEAGVAFACVFTQIFTQVLNVKPSFALGYSMGEVSMFAALGVWQQPAQMSQRLANSTTFNTRLSGDLLAVREPWQLPMPAMNSIPTAVWETYTLKATLAEVEAACVDEQRVFCTIINAPDSVLIAGFPEHCSRVFKKLNKRAIPLNMANAIHSPPAIPEYDAMVNLYTMAVNQRIATKLFSSSCYLPVPQLSQAIAHSLAKCLCERVDFPRLVNTVYDQGGRIFIEMGAGRSLSSWADKTLMQQKKSTAAKQGLTHASISVPVDAKGVCDEVNIFRAVATLLSHGVAMDVSCFFEGSIIMH
jgi:PfaB family protein